MFKCMCIMRIRIRSNPSDTELSVTLEYDELVKNHGRCYNIVKQSATDITLYARNGWLFCNIITYKLSSEEGMMSQVQNDQSVKDHLMIVWSSDDVTMSQNNHRNFVECQNNQRCKQSLEDCAMSQSQNNHLMVSQCTNTHLTG